jgi:flagellar hook-length control protein FliK
MTAPQDLIRPLPPSPSGATPGPGLAEAARKADGGTTFADAMRGAEGAKPIPGTLVDAPRAPTDARLTDEDRDTAATDVLQAMLPATPGLAMQVAGLAPEVASGQATAPATQAVAGTAATALLAPQGPVAPASTIASPGFAEALRAVSNAASATAPALADPVPTVSTGRAPLVATGLDTSAQPGGGVASSAEIDDVASRQPITDPSRAALAAASGSVAELAPRPVALAVQRAIGNALAALPSTASFSTNPAPRAPATDPARIASDGTASFSTNPAPRAPATDPARIASDGFVAALLRAAGNQQASSTATSDMQDTAAALLPGALTNLSRSATVGSVMPPDAATSGTTSGTATATATLLTTDAATRPMLDRWLGVSPDSMALALADRIESGISDQVKPRLERALQALDDRIAALTGSATQQEAATGSASPDRNPVDSASLAQAAQSQTNATAAPNTGTPEPMRLSIQAPVHQAERWATEMSDRLAWVANNRFSAATLQVNPPQLGPIEVRIALNGDQAAVSFAAVQPQTREAIQQALPALAASLAGQGLSLGQTTVGSQNQPQQGHDGQRGNPGQGLLIAGVTDTGAVASGSASSGLTRGGQGLVDTFA